MNSTELKLEIFTTRPDTIFGATFMVLAPESPYVELITTEEYRTSVEEYVAAVRHRSERERIADRSVSGVFTGAYAINPVTQKKLPIWIADYVLQGYGTGAIMAVPAHDSRDYAFAKRYGLEIVPVIENCSVEQESYDAKDGIMCNSGFLNGLQVKDAIAKMKDYIVQHNLGSVKVNYRLRDAVFSRQRYWGEPFPIYYKDGMPHPLPLSALPLTLPEVDKYLPTEDGAPPLGRAARWAWNEQQQKIVDNSLIDNIIVFPLEKNTMPGFAGSSAYSLRYMDSSNHECLVSKEKNDYWRCVDLYLGGIEHATGHLIHSRFWNKFLHDIGACCEDEPYKKLINQGMIQGRSSFVYRIVGTNTFVSCGLKDNYETQALHVDISLVEKDVLDVERFRKWRSEYADAEFLLEDGRYICGWSIEKMSKSMHNVVNPTDVADAYGADTLRMYVMFLGPLEMSKPWDSAGIEGVHRFLKKLWRLYHDSDGNYAVSDAALTTAELKTLHKTIKKVGSDIEAFSLNTAVSALMICVNELTDLRCRKRAALQPLVLLLAPFAPHIAEELWHLLGGTTSVCCAPFPDYDEQYLAEDFFDYPVSFNGKVRFKKRLALSISEQEAQQQILADPDTIRCLDGRQVKKIVFVAGKIVNIVV